MYKKFPYLKSPKDENIAIWRYMDFTKFVDLLERQKLFFACADKFEDLFEGSFPKENAKLWPMDYKEQTKYIFSILKKFTFINCWHMNDCESAAMWKLYLKSNEGIAIQSTFKRLKDSFNKTPKELLIGIGVVGYINYEKGGDRILEKTSITPYLHKRKSYEHEKELRAVNQQYPPGALDPNELGKYKGLHVAVELDTLIEKIYIAPNAPQWFSDLVKAVVERYNLNKTVKTSDLSKASIY